MIAEVESPKSERSARKTGFPSQQSFPSRRFVRRIASDEHSRVQEPDKCMS